MRPPTAIDGHADASYMVMRGRVWQFRRRVPFGLEDLDPRGEIRVSTGTRDKTRAALIAARINEALEEHWCNLLGSGATVHDATKCAERFDAAIRTAKETIST